MKRILILLITVALNCGLVLAQPQQSANFRIQKSVLDAGGAPGTSANFRLVSAFGQPSPIGFQSSTSFRLSGGFLSPTLGVSPLSPIQQLVIQQLNPDVRLAWPRVTGAAQYHVYRSTDPLFTPGPSNYLGTAADTVFTDANITALPATRNYYIVTALNALGLAMEVRRHDPKFAETAKLRPMTRPNESRAVGNVEEKK